MNDATDTTDEERDAGHDEDAGEETRLSRLVAAVAPQGAAQIALAVLAVCFLAGAIGYLIGTREAPVPTSEIDQGFLLDMSDHHDQAISMALCTVPKTGDTVVRSMAIDVLVFQNRELARMGSLLEQMEVERPPTEGRTAMAWMGMPTPVEQMPGMATPAELEELCAATGRDVDRLFLRLMREHHLGGVHMAEVAQAQAASPRVRSLAETMVRNQRIEANEYAAHEKRLGLTN
jgi:uncharacterized protein (DUF305 family)